MAAHDLNPRILGHLVQLKAEAEPDRAVLTFEGTSTGTADEVLTYGSLWEASGRLATKLAARGIEPGQRVAIFMRNHPEFVYGMVACSVIGAVFVPIDPRQKGEKLRHQLAHAECRAVLTTSDLVAAVERLLSGLPVLRTVLVSRRPGGPEFDTRRYEDLAAVLEAPLPSTPAQRVRDLRHPIEVIYTSGTTGDPKGVVTESGRWMAVGSLLANVFGYRHEDHLYTGLSLTHGNAQAVTLLPALLEGIPAVFSPRFTKSRIWDICRRYGCTTFSLLGGMMAAIYAEPPRPDDADNPVRTVVSAGTPPAIWEVFERRFGVQILEWYAAVEGGFAYKPPGQGPVGSFGRPIEGLMEMRIVDENDQECPPGVVGELVSRLCGVETRVEYLKDAEASAAKTRGGWLRSGDMCWRDAEGWFYFSHRKGSEIRHNGEFIQPSFIEKVIAEQPGVSDVCVYGIPAASGAPGERDVVAAVVPAEGEELDPAALFRACAEALERNQIPSYIQILPEIPKTVSEKPQERFLAEELRLGRHPVYRKEDFPGAA